MRRILSLLLVAAMGCGAQPRIPAMTLDEALTACTADSQTTREDWNSLLITLEAWRDNGQSKTDALSAASTVCAQAIAIADPNASLSDPATAEFFGSCNDCMTGLVDALWR